MSRPDDRKGVDGELDRLRQEAEFVESGAFRLDWSRALDKIQRFKLADAHRYVLELVQSAVAAGASEIDIAMDADDMVLVHDGKAVSERELGSLFDFLFSSDPAAAHLRALALGINTGLGMAPKFVQVDSGDGEQGARLWMRSLADYKLQALPGGTRETRVHLRERMSWKVLAEALYRDNPEQALLERHCRFAPVPVRLGGKDLRQPLVGGLAWREFQVGELRGGVMLPADLFDSSWIALCMHGVEVEEHRAVENGWLGRSGILAFLDSPRFTRDASHSKVVCDQTFSEAMVELRMQTRHLLADWIRWALLEQKPAGAWPQADLYPLPRARYLILAAELLWPRSEKLPAEFEALLDVEGLVPLPFERPSTGTLRPFWQAYGRGGACRTASRCYRLEPGDLPEDLPVALGQNALLRAVFGRRFECVDERLERTEHIRENRLARQRQRRPPVLPAASVMARCRIRLDEPAVEGECGLSSDPEDRTLRVTFLAGGVPLEEDRSLAGPFRGRAVLECAAFEPNAMWDGVAENQAFRASLARLGEAVPGLLQALRERFDPLPPPDRLRRIRGWTPSGERVPGGEFQARGDACLARRHADQLLARISDASEEPGWLWTWRIFHRLDGSAVCLAEIAPEPGEPVFFVQEIRWGDGEQDRPVLNLSRDQVALLRSWLADRLTDRQVEVRRRRSELELGARRRKIRERNLATAQERRQWPRLAPARYLVRVDLPGMTGQVGVPAEPEKSFIRFLVEGLPVCDLPWSELDRPFPIQAVVEAEGIQPDETFSEVERGEAFERVVEAVAQSRVPLVKALLALWDLDTRELRRREILWDWLHSRIRSGAPFEELVPALVRFPLVDSVSHGQLSLLELRAQAAQAGELYWVSFDAERQQASQPLLRLTREQAQSLRKLLGVRLRDHSAALRKELAALEHLDKPVRHASLGGSLVLKVPVEGPGLSGELGLPARAGELRGQARVQVLLGGRPLEKRKLRLYYLPLVGVVDSDRFEPTEGFGAVRKNSAWKAAVAALGRAARRLVTEGCARLAARGLPLDQARLVRPVFQRLLGRLEKKPADQRSEADGELGAILRAAPLWETPEGQLLCLPDLQRGLDAQGVIWVVKGRRGHPAEGRVVICDYDEETRKALDAIFGQAVSDGEEVLRRDDAGHEWRCAAPAMPQKLGPDEVIESEPLAASGEGWAVQGWAGLRIWASSAGVRIAIGLEGRQLCSLDLDHPLPGKALVDCRGLEVDRRWTGLARDDQREIVEQAVSAALWRSLDKLAERLAGKPGSDGALLLARRIFLGALAAGAEGGAMPGSPTSRLADSPDPPRGQGAARIRPQSRSPLEERIRSSDAEIAVEVGNHGRVDRLRDLPLFETVEGEYRTAREILSATGSGKLEVVSAQAGAGRAPEGQLIVRADEPAMAALEALLGERIERFDDAWQEALRWQGRAGERAVLEVLKQNLRSLIDRAGARALHGADIEALDIGELGDALLSAGPDVLWLNPAHPIFRAARQAVLPGGAEGSDRTPVAVLYLMAAFIAAAVPAKWDAAEACTLLEALAAEAVGE
ncbi:MAG: hypothetical protein JXR96_12885 [Deltaproteobacteria bacterium]|nr:hypothetical protein [Deltaproteobacteria bacterium]